MPKPIPTSEARLGRIERTLRRDRCIAAAGAACLVAVVLASWQERPARAEFDQLTAKRIDVVDERGQRRIVLACAERFPLPMLKGKEWPRSIAPAGMVFYKADGDECGGLGMAEVGGARKNMLILDYANSEAIGIGMLETTEGSYSAGLSIVERMPLDADIGQVGTSGPERIGVSNEGGSAQIRLADALGRTRIRISVEPGGEGGIELLDESGAVVERWP
jgi:hypothetical protein